MSEAPAPGTEPGSTEPASTEPESKQPASKEPESKEYVQVWAESFSQVLGQVAGSAVPCQLQAEAPREAVPPAEEDLWVLVTSSGALRGEVSLRLASPAVLRLGQIFMSEPPAPEAVLTPDHREAVVELLRQISGIAASAAKGRWGELQLGVESAAAAPPWAPAETLWLQVRTEEGQSRLVEFGLSAALVAELRAGKIEAAKSGEKSSPAAPASGAEPTSGAFDLLMDVQLAVSMRFGSRRLLLREVLDLSPGSVVELDRRVQEPVDLLLDGRLVARGEVVIIDGSYGLRVTDVSPLALPLARQDG